MKIAYLLIGSLVWITCQEDTESIKPRINSVTESVYASVTVQPAYMYSLSSPIPGVIHNIYVAEGDTVKKGQLIAQIRATDSRIGLEQAVEMARFATERYAGESTVLNSLKDEIEVASKQLVLDSLNHQRQKRLWSKGIGSRAEFEAREMQYRSSKNKLVKLTQKYDQTTLELRNNQIQSQNALKLAKSNLNDHQITASSDGRVFDLFKKEGELIALQEPLAQVGSVNDFILEMSVDEVDIARIKEGQRVLITLDAYPSQLFEAGIDKIYPLKNARTQTFKIEGRFKDPPSVLYAGLSGEANIVVAKRKDVVTIPLSYLKDDETVITEDGVKSVKIGIRNLDHTEILDGVDTSVLLFKPKQ